MSRQLASIGSGASVSIQTASGLGRDIGTLSENQIIVYQKVSPRTKYWMRTLTTAKAEFANKLLFIATLAFAKLSIISLLMFLTISDIHHMMATGLAATVALWGVVAEFVAAFQCGTQDPLRFIGPEHHCQNLVRQIP